MLVAETPYDLRFRLLGVPVRVHPLFWLISAVMGLQAFKNDMPAVLLWMGCVFFSVLVHEFGHALSSKAFSYSPSVILWAMGGLCYSQGEEQTPRERLAVLFAGPGAGFLLCALTVVVFWALVGPSPLDQAQWIAYNLGLSQSRGDFAEKFRMVLDPESAKGKFAYDTYSFLVQINLFWGFVNLLPVWPLDGGQVTQVLLTMYDRARGQRWGHIVSLLVAGGVALVWYAVTQSLPLTIFFGYFALVNYQVLQTLHQAHSMGYQQDDDWWRR